MTTCRPFMCDGAAHCGDTTCPGLLQRDGGHSVAREVSVKLDPPLYSPEQTEGWAVSTLAFIGVAGIAMVCAAFYWGIAPAWPFM